MTVFSPSLEPKQKSGACEEEAVAKLYRSEEVAEQYICDRFRSSWGSLLHEKQVATIERVIRKYRPQQVLELAPGPARIATSLQGIRQGLMLEYSHEMIAIAQKRLEAAGLDQKWQLQHGNAFELHELDRKFDLVFTFRFIRHFRKDERLRLYSSIGSCMYSDSLLIFDVVNRRIRDNLDAGRAKNELDVYDVTYSPESFRREMRDNGFQVIGFVPVLTHFVMQQRVSSALDRRIRRAAEWIIDALEVVPTRQPLEWIAICRKT